MKSEFNNWLIENKPDITRPDKYSGTIVTIANHIKKERLTESPLLSILDSAKLKILRKKYFNKEEFYLKNKKGNSMYSRSFDLYIQFIEENSEKLVVDEEIKIIRTDSSLSATEKQSLILSRYGQGRYRSELITMWGKCCISHFKDVRLLTASHIKPWRISNNQERLDPYNGLLLLPNFDKLFDDGFISFNNQGKILISAEVTEREKLNLHNKITIKIFEKHSFYLNYHRNNLFLG